MDQSDSDLENFSKDSRQLIAKWRKQQCRRSTPEEGVEIIHTDKDSVIYVAYLSNDNEQENETDTQNE